MIEGLSIKREEQLKRAVEYIVWLERKGHHEGWACCMRVLYLLGFKLCPACEGQTTYLQPETAHVSEGWVPCYNCNMIGVVEQGEESVDGA